MLKRFVLILFLLSTLSVKAFDASPFNTQSAELSQGGWWTVYAESFFDSRNKFVSPLFAEYRYTFFDKLRLGLLGGLAYASDGESSKFGFSHLIFTNEYEIYDLDKHNYLDLAGFELVDHANIFFNHFFGTVEDESLGFNSYSFNTGVEWQKALGKYLGFYSELGYFQIASESAPTSHNFLYNNSISFEINSWFQPYIELLGLTDFARGDTSLLLAPGISLVFDDNYYFYVNPIFNVTGSDDTWGFQIGLSGNI